MLFRHPIIVFFLATFSWLSGQENSTDLPIIRGIYGSPAPLWQKGYRLDELGVNAVFVRSGAINAELMARARTENQLVFAEFATLNGKSYVEEHPEAWAINERGERVEAAGWFMGVCPTEPGFRQYRYDQLRNLLRQYDLDGVWMDYVHWHAQFEEPEPILPETCFCDHCLSTFQSAAGIQLPEGKTAEKAQWILTNHDAKWRDWRCAVIADWARDMKKILAEERPGALLGIYHCPWTDAEFDGARRRILGLDYDLLKGVADVFSPMVYHERMGRDAAWVKQNIKWFGKRLRDKSGTNPKIWPIVQAHDVSAGEFAKVLKGGLVGKSTGVMMFTSNSVAADEETAAVMKTRYLKLKSKNR